MKKRIILTLTGLFTLFGARAAGPDPPTDPERFVLGVHTGIDIGAAVPWPPGKQIGGGNKMHAVPHLTPALGLSYTLILDPRWSLTAETTYKVVSLDAKAWVESQTFYDRSEGMMVVFRGTARMSMKFPMMEFPVFARFTFGNGTNRVFLGGYYARVFGATFVTSPYKGMLTRLDPDENPPVLVDPSDPNTQDFSDAMESWDAGFVMGYERHILPRVTLSGRFSMGLKDIFRRDRKYLTYNMLHMRGTLTVSYLFLAK